MWSAIGQKRRDIYPLVGAKHKKWIIEVHYIDREGKFNSKKFESSPGYNADIDQIWMNVKGFLSLVTGDTNPF